MPIRKMWNTRCLKTHSLSCTVKFWHFPRKFSQISKVGTVTVRTHRKCFFFLHKIMPDVLKDYSLKYVTEQLSLTLLTAKRTISNLPWSKYSYISVNAKKRIFYTVREHCKLPLGNVDSGMLVEEKAVKSTYGFLEKSCKDRQKSCKDRLSTESE